MINNNRIIFDDILYKSKVVILIISNKYANIQEAKRLKKKTESLKKIMNK